MAMATTAQAATFAPEDGLEAIANSDYIASYPSEFRDSVDPDTIWNHDHVLSVDIGPRVAGTAAEDAAADYVQGLFEDFGFDVELETFDASSQSYANVTPSRYTDEFASWQFRPAANARFTGPDTPVSGELVDVGDGSDLASVDLNGKIALVDWVPTAQGDSSERDGLLNDLNGAGAAIIVLAQTSGSESLPRLRNVPADLEGSVVVTAATNQGERMRALLEQGPLDLSITTEKSRDTSTNVIGTKPAPSGDPDAPIVYIGSHIDSVVGSPGASDNGSGVSIMLEIARIIGQYELDVEIRAGAWGAEEIGIIGSRHHVGTLTQSEIDRTIGAWNMDMAGTSHEGTPDQPFGFWALTVDGATAEENAVLNYGNLISQQIGDGDPNIGQVGRSDHQYFHDAGIDAAVFSWMYWAGGTNIVLEPAYHQTTDTLEFVSAERMGYAGQVLGSSAFLAALNEVSVDVVDENGAPAGEVPVAMKCGDDDGWREVGVTDGSGSVGTVAPHITCDFAALAANGAQGSALAAPIAGDTEVSLELQVDSEAPVVTISAEPGAGTTGWHTSSPVIVTVEAADDHDDNPVVQYSLDGDTWQDYTGAIALEENGEFLVQARATDSSGNTGEADLLVRIDTTDQEDSDSSDGASDDEELGGGSPGGSSGEDVSGGGQPMVPTGVDSSALVGAVLAFSLLTAGAMVLVIRRVRSGATAA